MKFTMTVDMESEAFVLWPERELSRILHDTARKITEGWTGGICDDLNGDDVGLFNIEV